MIYKKTDPTWNLMKNGATKEEREFLVHGRDYSKGYHGQRVELNAFPSRDLVDWIEGKLEANGIKKVIPDDDVLADAYRRAIVRREIHKATRKVEQKAKLAAEKTEIPGDLVEQIESAFAEDGSISWDAALNSIILRNSQPNG